LSFDLGTGGLTSPEYLYQGFVGDTQVLAGSASPGGLDFITITNLFPAILIDRLVITTTLTSSSANIDNINLDLVSSVPEPGTVTLGMLGLAGLFLVRCRRAT
jgi:MYXO-CTERM domain-containing protein